MTDYSNLVNYYSAEEYAKTTLHSHRQPYDTAVLNILEDGKVSLTIDTTFTSNDGTTFDVWHGRTMEFSINGNPDLDELASLLGEGGKASVLVDRVIAGHDVEWNGNNMVGTLTEDAREASEALAALLEEVSQSDLAFWEAGDWLLSSMSHARVLDDADLTVDATDEQIEKAAETLVASARADNVIVDQSDVEGVLRECIERVRDDEDIEVEG